MAIGRIDRLQLYRADMPVGEEKHQPALPEVFANDKVGQEDDTDSQQGGVAQEFERSASVLIMRFIVVAPCSVLTIETTFPVMPPNSDPCFQIETLLALMQENEECRARPIRRV